MINRHNQSFISHDWIKDVAMLSQVTFKFWTSEGNPQVLRNGTLPAVPSVPCCIEGIGPSSMTWYSTLNHNNDRPDSQCTQGAWPLHYSSEEVHGLGTSDACLRWHVPPCAIDVMASESIECGAADQPSFACPHGHQLSFVQFYLFLCFGRSQNID